MENVTTTVTAISTLLPLVVIVNDGDGSAATAKAASLELSTLSVNQSDFTSVLSSTGGNDHFVSISWFITSPDGLEVETEGL